MRSNTNRVIYGTLCQTEYFHIFWYIWIEYRRLGQEEFLVRKAVYPNVWRKSG